MGGGAWPQQCLGIAAAPALVPVLLPGPVMVIHVSVCICGVYKYVCVDTVNAYVYYLCVYMHIYVCLCMKKYI